MTLRRLLLIGLLLWGTPVQAQVLDTGSITINSTGGACSIVASCAAFSLANATIASVTLQVSGTFTGTLTFEGTSDNTTWFTISGTKLSDGSTATTTTTTGQFAFANSGLLGIRARATAAMTGTATVTAARGYAVARWLTPFFSSVTASSYLAVGTTYAATGAIRLENTAAIKWRNAANSADITGIDVTSGDVVDIAPGGQNISMLGGFGPLAGAGAIRLPNNYTVQSRNAGDSANICIWQFDSSNNIVFDCNANANSVGTSGTFYVTGAGLTVGAATGLTVSSNGRTQTTTYKVVVDRTAFVCNAVTCDLTIGTLPADTQLGPVYAKLTTTFACTATCTTATLSMVLGKGAGGAEYLASLDADAATAVFGDADAELGTLLVRAAAINGGTYNTASQAVVLRLISGTGVVGNGAATNLSQGSITIWLTTTRMS